MTKQTPPHASNLSLTEQSYGTLRSAILSSVLAPESVWSDRELCENFNLSRTPVREALLRLQAQGLVQIVPRRGTRILSLNTNDVREINQLSKALELSAALLIAKDPGNPTALADISTAVEKMEDALQQNNLEQWAIADAKFHDLIVEHCGNKRIAEVYRSQRGLTDRARHFTLRLRPLPIQSTQEHREMYEAMREQDLIKLEHLYRQHWDRTTEEIIRIIKEHSQGVAIPTFAKAN